MDKVELNGRTGYFNLDIKIPMNNLLINVLYVTYESGSPSWVVPNHSHTFYGLHYIPSGKGKMGEGGKTHQLVPGTFYLVPPGFNFEQFSDQSDPMAECFIYFDLKVSDKRKEGRLEHFIQNEVEQIIRPLTSKAIEIGNDQGGSIDLFGKIQYELENRHTGYYIKLHNLLSEVFVNFARSVSKEKTATYDIPQKNFREKRKLVIESLLNLEYRTITKEQLAGALGIGVRQLERLCRKYFNSTFNEKLIEVRMERAKYLLENTEMSFGKIAEDLGMLNANYFGIVFKKCENITPSRFRKLYRNTSGCTKEI